MKNCLSVFCLEVNFLNWRIKAMERYYQLKQDSELLFTAPLTISAEDIPKVRAKTLSYIEEVMKIVSESGAEELCCLNIDWVHVN